MVWTPLSMPFLTSAGSASPASASRPSRISPMTSAAASGLSSLRSVKCRSAARAWVDIHVRRVAGRRQRRDPGQQLRRGRQALERPGQVPAARSDRGASRGLPVEHVFHGARLAWPDRQHVGVLAGDELPVQRAALGQLLLRAEVGDPAAVQDHDPLGQVQRRPAVRDDQRGAAPHHLAQRGVDLRLQARVDSRGGVVEDQHPGIGDQGPGQRHPLPLAAGQSQALLADHGVVTVGQPDDELVGLRRLGCGDDLLIGGVRPAVGDVVPHRGGEQEAVLHDQPDRGAQ